MPPPALMSGRRCGKRRPGMFRSGRYYGTFTISDIVVDASDVPVVGAVVKLFQTGVDVKIAQTVTDATGRYTFLLANNSGFFYAAVCGPSVTGLTVDTLVAVQS